MAAQRRCSGARLTARALAGRRISTEARSAERSVSSVRPVAWRAVTPYVVLSCFALGCQTTHADRSTPPSGVDGSASVKSNDVRTQSPTDGSVATMRVGDRVFYLVPLFSQVAGIDVYSLQVEGDGLIASFGCKLTPTVSPGFSVRGSTITLCSGQYTVTVGPNRGEFVVNGNTLMLASDGAYSVRPDGSHIRRR